MEVDAFCLLAFASLAAVESAGETKLASVYQDNGMGLWAGVRAVEIAVKDDDLGADAATPAPCAAGTHPINSPRRS